jgi:hypothetical protein
MQDDEIKKNKNCNDKSKKKKPFYFTIHCLQWNIKVF